VPDSDANVLVRKAAVLDNPFSLKCSLSLDQRLVCFVTASLLNTLVLAYSA
jgi:hypothetical protein